MSKTAPPSGNRWFHKAPRLTGDGEEERKMRNKREQKRRRLSLALLALAMFATFFAAPGAATAQRRWRGDIRRFHERDFGVWRGGRWVHGWHFRRFGWWWVIPGGWYFYPAPVYPYPDPYIPPAVGVAPSSPVVQAQPQAQTWYYCDSAGGYYPYVPECPTGWRAMPATPAPPTPPTTPPPPPTTPPPPPPNRY